MEESIIEKTEDRWHNWRTLAAYVYLTICTFDFILMPALTHINHVDTKAVIVELLEDRIDRDFVLDIIDRVDGNQWDPLTLIGGGLFHISFGAILTGVAVTRGQERTEIVKNGKA